MAHPLRKLWRWLAGSFAALVILLAVAVGLFRLLLPQVPAYHAQIESWASKAVGLPVKLGSLDARWSFGGPALTFRNARLFARDETNVLIEAARGSVAINLGVFLRQGKVQPGKVVLTGTRLSLERSEAGILHLAGQVPPEGGAKRAMAPVLQVLPRGDFEIEDASLVYEDHRAGRGPWRFSDVDLHIDYGRTRLLIEGSARLPAILGEEVDFKLSTRDSLADPLAIRWQGSARAAQLNLAGLGELLPENMPKLLSGRLDLVSNLSMVGRNLEQVSANITVREVSFSGDAGEQPGEGWSRLSGLFEWNRQASGWQASASNLICEREGHTWPASRLTLERTISSDKTVEIVYLNASYMRLQDLQPIRHWLPDGDARRALEALAPRGELREFVVNRSLRDGETVSYALRSEFDGLAVSPFGAVPGVENLSGVLRMDNAGGFLELNSRDSRLALEGLYDAPLMVDAAGGSIGWQKVDEDWVFSSERLSIATPAFGSETDFSLTIPGDDLSPVLRLESNIRDLDLAASRAFLPGKKMPPMAYRWLQGALVSGRAPETTVSFEGPVRAYPFRNNEGHFRARTIIEDMRFAFARDWPAIEGARFETVFENASLKSRIISGSMSGNDVSGSTAEIGDLAESVLIVQGQSRGTVDDLLAFMRESPVSRVLGPRINDIRGAGGAQSDVVVNLPLTRMEDFRINGNTAVQAEWLGISGLDQRLTQLDGDINFTEKAVRANDISARLFGRAVTLNIRPGSDASGLIDATLVDLEGRHSSANLTGNLPFPVPVVLDGETSWQAIARFPKPSTEGESFGITVETGLSGMAVILPDPLVKPADEPRRVSLEIRFPADGQITMAADYGNILTSNSRFLKMRGEWRHDRTAVRLGGPRPGLPPSEGMIVTGDADSLAVDDWLRVDWGETQEERQESLLRSVNIGVNQMYAYGQVIPEARIKLDRNAREWLAQVTSDRVEGSMLIPADVGGNERVFADMVRLVLMPEAETDEQAPGSDPRTLPAMRIMVAEFVYDDMNFGSLEADIIKTPDGLALESFRTRDPGFSVEGGGRWEIAGGAEVSAVEFTLTASDVRRALTQLAFDPVMKADDARVYISGSWPGPPDRHFRERISGSVNVRVGAGQLLEVEPGAGRMFGLLSIAALPRRLSLDFRDVFDSGFGFDSITGDFELVEGQAYTNNLLLEGPAADIGIAGRAGLAERDYDQTAIVRANLGSALPVAGAIAAGPAVGAALLIFSEILKDPLKDMSKVFYRVTGSWDAPDIYQVTQAVAEAPTPESPAQPEADPGGG